ncbi:AAA family ATPase [Microseira wollei]|uniref:ORC1/DEAH AAA+ ATPase domain-containing protein n=1 Tax=Microseira wollei NIES-4236 TaxID=2530354 RepID=A0AAV3X2F8_9CYAN|nr:AAA family ATPase [Microseira wollei]GET36368.1 hypothetical protein MiSe_11170 [Microseira wollei NIES-4236]
MTSPNVPRNAYTDAPEQHPNLIIGSLQLLLWVFFRPSAGRNHLSRIDPSRDPAFWKLLIQALLVLPVLTNSIVVALVLGLLRKPVQEILLGVVSGVVLGVMSGVVWTVALSLVGLMFNSVSGVVWAVASGLTLGVVWGVASGVRPDMTSGLASGWGSGLELGLGLGVLWGVLWGMVWAVMRFVKSHSLSNLLHTVVLGMLSGVVLGAALGAAFGLLSGVAPEMIGLWILGIILGITINLWLPVMLYPFLSLGNFLLYRLEQLRTTSKPSLLHRHSAFWNESQRLRLYGLDKHVLLIMERNPDEGKAALNYLSTSRQRWAARAVQIELDARELERCTDVKAISNAHRSLAVGELNSPVSSLLSSFSRISEDVDAALNKRSAYYRRLDLLTVAEKLNGLIRELTRSSGSDQYAVRFLPIANNWYEVVRDHVRQLAETVELRQEVDNPYIVGNPLTEQQEIFTGRTDIGKRMEQFIFDRRRPPLLLYGQRRMGKTSLLNNLGRLLPSTIIPMFVDLQGPVSSARDYAGFLYNIARSMAASAKRQSGLTLPSLNRETLQDDPFTRFDEWLDKVEEALQQNIALLALDEFEALDKAFTKGRFDEQDVLGMLRHLIQHRPRFKVLLAGSHTIEEFQRWASYLINVQVLHISYLKEAEACKLIEQPVQDFTLRYEPKAVERVLQLTRCHPFLIQLLCREIITLKNEQDPSIRRLATLADVEAAIPKALSVGSLFFADIQNNQIDAAGLAILRFLSAQGEGAIVSRKTILQQFPDEYNALDLLRQRELIEEVGDGYRFQVELIRRWFAQQLTS